MPKQQIQYSNASNKTQDELIYKNQISHRLMSCCMLAMKLSFLMREFPRKSPYPLWKAEQHQGSQQPAGAHPLPKATEQTPGSKFIASRCLLNQICC